MSIRSLPYEPSTLFALALAVAAALMGATCAKDDSRERLGKAISSLEETRDELADASKQVDAVLAAASGVQSSQGNLQAAYNRYKKEVKKTEEAAEDSRTRAHDMRARSAEYQGKWQAEMSKVTNPDLKAAAGARAAKVRGRYEMISAKAQAAQAAYAPFITDLKDLQRYLSVDLTPTAVREASTVFDKVNASGRVLKQKLAALQQELDDVAGEMSAAAGSST